MIVRRPSNTCTVVLASCEAPANSPIKIYTRCFACGEHVCKTCSRIVQYYSYGHCRVCVDCIDTHSDRIKEIS